MCKFVIFDSEKIAFLSHKHIIYMYNIHVLQTFLDFVSQGLNTWIRFASSHTETSLASQFPVALLEV